MSNTTSHGSAPRVLFMGMVGAFSTPSLLALLDSGVEVCAVVLPARAASKDSPPVRSLEPLPRVGSLPVLSSSLHSSIVNIAWERSIPVWEVSRMNDVATHALCASYSPDLFCVACFSLYIPRAILDIPRLGCLNVHPSLLPSHRGPDPLFWTFHQGSCETGVTIHLMDEGLDTGPMVAQERIDVPEGITYAQLEARCAQLGGKLLVRSVWELFNGTARTRPQDEAKSSYLPMPTSEDYVVPVREWPAERVYRFVRGVASREQPVTLFVEDEPIRVKNAISYSHKDAKDHDDLETVNLVGETRQVRCKDGWVRVMLVWR
ncbi:MAG TPA: methionyl-tRNA formyltransferase [Ktedonobacteraceae bacterium]|nr:methionyl-tRNA formyltransferase [Ktedonobacteraceae bacterium]